MAVWDLGRWFLLVAGVGGGADFSGLRGGNPMAAGLLI